MKKQLKSTIDNVKTTKKQLICFLCLFMFLYVSVFAETPAATTSSQSGLNDIFKTVLLIFTGWYTKVIALSGLVMIGVKMITSRGEQQLVKALMPWFIAAVIIGGSSTICGLFIKDFSAQVNAATGSNLLDKL